MWASGYIVMHLFCCTRAAMQSMKFFVESRSSGSGIAPRLGVIFPSTGMETLFALTMTYTLHGNEMSVGMNASHALFVWLPYMKNAGCRSDLNIFLLTTLWWKWKVR